MDPRMAQRRRSVAETRARRGVRRLLVFLAVVAVGAIGLAVLRSSLFSLATVDVFGAVSTDPAALAAEEGAVVGTPLMDLDLDAIRTRLGSEPRIRSVEVSRRWPTELRIVVEERMPVAWVDRGAGWEHMAVDGVVVESGTPAVDDPRVRAAPGDDRPVEAALRFVDALEPPLRTGMLIDATSPELVATWSGYIIRLGRATDMAQKARALAAVVADAPPEGSEITLIAPDRPAVMVPGADGGPGTSTDSTEGGG